MIELAWDQLQSTVGTGLAPGWPPIDNDDYFRLMRYPDQWVRIRWWSWHVCGILTEEELAIWKELLVRANSIRDGAHLVFRLSSMFVLVALLAIPAAQAQVPAGKPDDVGLSAKRLERIGEMIERAADEDQISGPSPSSCGAGMSPTSRRTV